jgi:hypothetical protein
MDLRKYLGNEDGEKYHPVVENGKHIGGTSSDHSLPY